MDISTSSVKEVNAMEANDIDEDSFRNENVQLLKDIAQLCNREDRKSFENILLLGMVGAGKSALVNTLINAVSGSYIPKAKVGAGLRQSKTFTLNRYESCGVTREDIIDETRRDIVQGILPRLPTIFDVAGRYDTNTDALREILELLIGGFIQPGTSTETLEDLQEEHHVGFLKKELFTKSQPEWKATKIVFVQSVRDKVPENLIKCLHTVLKSTNPETAQPLYTEDVFVVITKYYLVMGQHNYNRQSEDKTITMEQFKILEKDVAKLFNIEGALGDNRICWVSYTDDSGSDNPYIDNIALKFIKRMVLPGCPPVKAIKPMKTLAVRIKLWLKGQDLTVTDLCCVLAMIIIAVVLFLVFAM